MDIILTLADAFKAGYIINEFRWQPGYVTRKKRTPEQIPIEHAGGHRKGQMYVSLPCSTSTRFCYRAYLVPIIKGGEKE